MKVKSLSFVGVLLGVFVVGLAASDASAADSMVNIAQLKMVEPDISPQPSHCTFKVVQGAEVAAKVHMVLKYQDHGGNFGIIVDKEVPFLPEMMADGVYTQVVPFGPSSSGTGNRFWLIISVIDVNGNETHTLQVHFLAAS